MITCLTSQSRWSSVAWIHPPNPLRRRASFSACLWCWSWRIEAWILHVCNEHFSSIIPVLSHKELLSAPPGTPKYRGMWFCINTNSQPLFLIWQLRLHFLVSQYGQCDSYLKASDWGHLTFFTQIWVVEWCSFWYSGMNTFINSEIYTLCRCAFNVSKQQEIIDLSFRSVFIY